MIRRFNLKIDPCTKKVQSDMRLKSSKIDQNVILISKTQKHQVKIPKKENKRKYKVLKLRFGQV